MTHEKESSLRGFLELYVEAANKGATKVAEYLEALYLASPSLFVPRPSGVGYNLPKYLQDYAFKIFDFSNILDPIRRGEKINAIKEARAAFGLGLKEAKDVVDEFIRLYPKEFQKNPWFRT